MKKYLNVIVITKTGKRFINPLKLSEVHFISKLAQENEELTVQCFECSEAGYKAIFG